MGLERLLADLRKDLADGEVLVVVGTGVSIQATGNAPCSRWDGLIANGIEHCVQIGRLTEAEAQPLREQLEKKDVESLITVAEQVSAALGAPGDGEFQRWLDETVGALELRNPAIIDAVHALRAPIATTNYDDLLSRDRGIPRVPWTDGAAAHKILRGDHAGILHFHGCHDRPESVILGARSYKKLLAKSGPQAIQQAFFANRTFLFIGCGEGLTDPNFGALLEWSAKAFPGSTYRHYALCRIGESEPLKKRMPRGVRLSFIEYGDDFNDLGPFLLKELAAKPRSAPLPSAGHCFGREGEVEAVVAAMLDCAAIPLLGGPGMGKTTVALTAAHDPRVAKRFGERRWFVRLDGVKSRADLAGAVGFALGLPITPAVEAAVLDTLAKKSALLILDNAETPLDADETAVDELFGFLAEIDTLALAVTIRGQKRPRGGRFTPTVEPKSLAPKDAREAFVAVSGRKQFANDRHLDALLEELGGVPLAITLMARYAEAFESLDLVWKEWQAKKTAMLKDGDKAHRLTDIAVSYELSIGVLSPEARRLLSVLAMLPDGAAHGDVSALMDGADAAAYELRRRALVFDEAGRLRMLAPLREHVRAAHPPDTGDEKQVVEHYLELAASGGKVGAAGGAEAVARLAPEVANIEAILFRGVGEETERINRAAYGWSELMRFTGLGSAAPIERLAEHALATGRTRHAARCLVSLGDIAFARSKSEEAQERYEEAQPLYRQLADVLGEATCIRSLGDIALRRSEYDKARERYEEAQGRFRQVGNVLGEANCLWSLGDIALRRSEYEEARKRYEEAQPLYRQVGNVLGEANCIRSLGDVALRRSEHEEAWKRHEEAQPLYRQVGNVLGEANCILRLGDIALGQSEYEEARKRYEEARRCIGRWEMCWEKRTATLALATCCAQPAKRMRRKNDTLTRFRCTSPFASVTRSAGRIADWPASSSFRRSALSTSPPRAPHGFPSAAKTS